MHIKNLSARHREEALRAIRNRKFDYTDTGIVIPSMQMGFDGGFEVAGNDGIWDVVPNLVVMEGRTRILDVALSQGTQDLGLYLALFSTNVAVADNWTGATWGGLAGEFTNYDEATRPAWAEAGGASGSITNTATPAVFTMSAGGGTIRGIALVTASAKGATTGALIAASRLLADKVMTVGEELRVKYTMNATST